MTTLLIGYQDADGRPFSARVEALDWSDAERQLPGIRLTGRIEGEPIEEGEAEGLMAEAAGRA